MLVISLFAQTAVAIFLLEIRDFDLNEQGDTEEYIGIADNIIDGRGYSAELEPPWRPTGSRSPGMLITNVPLRLLFADNDSLALAFGKIMFVLIVALFFIVARYFEESDLAIFVVVAFTLIPSVVYYMINSYASNPPYLLAFVIIYVGMVLLMQSRNYIAVLLMLVGAMYAMSTRPAALFPLVGLGMAGLVGGWLVKDRKLRRKVLIIGATVLLGTSITYLTWSYRNYREFGSFQYSTVGGFNLLHFNVKEMMPYLSESGKQAVEDALDAHPIYIHTYHGEDQFEIADEQGAAAVELIKEYPLAFFSSHVIGTLRGFFLFEVAQLDQVLGKGPSYVAALYQTLLTIAAAYGLIIKFNTLDNSRKAVLLLMLTTGLVNVLSGGALSRPKYRIPLEPVVALGLFFFVKDYVAVKFLPQQADSG